MKIVLYYDGPFQGYAVDSIQQLKHSNWNTRIVILTPQVKEWKEALLRHNIWSTDAEYFNPESLVDYKQLQSLAFQALGHEKNPLWHTSLSRLAALLAYANAIQEDIWHIEMDVMVYAPFEVLSKPSQTSFVRATDKEVIASVGFIKHDTAQELLRLITQNVLNRRGQGFFNEMEVLSDLQHNGIINTLPYLPSHSSRYLCDPASYGQYLGGTPHNNATPGWVEARHHIGNAIIRGEISVERNEAGYPIVKLPDGKIYPLFNLHVHNKKTHEYRIRN